MQINKRKRDDNTEYFFVVFELFFHFRIQKMELSSFAKAQMYYKLSILFQKYKRKTKKSKLEKKRNEEFKMYACAKRAKHKRNQ